jgi:D-sedoheptulose 7-phosphate isomerase
MQQQMIQSIDDAIQAISFLKTEQSITFMEKASAMIAEAFVKGRKILIAGNGGSLCDAMHFAEELTGFFRAKRKPLPAIALSDPGHLTCVSNDSGFEHVFARSVEALGQPGDIFIALTTSGNSPNLLHALHAAKKNQMQTIAFLGKSGGHAKGLADLEWIVAGFTWSDRIQEAHMAAIHIIIEAVENHLFNPAVNASEVLVAHR